MTPASASQTREAPAGPFLPRAGRVRSGAERYVAGLRAALAITEDQMEAWTAFAESLWANRQRMGTGDYAESLPYGALEDRLTALASMRHAAAELFAVLDAAQQRKALLSLPLCCLPQAAALV